MTTGVKMFLWTVIINLQVQCISTSGICVFVCIKLFCRFFNDGKYL